MILTPQTLPGVFNELQSARATERPRLAKIRAYHRKNDEDSMFFGPLRWLAAGVPFEIRRLAIMSRLNVIRLVVNSAVESMYVDGFRSPTAADNGAGWDAWQKNRFDARQIGTHRSALKYGYSYVTILPGDTKPAIRGVSPRNMTALYGEDDDWPEVALELRNPQIGSTKPLYRIYDDQQVWYVESDGAKITPVGPPLEHGVGHVPIVRMVATMDDDGEPEGEVEPLIAIQDQIDVTTFGLLVAQHYGAFRQRYVLGWLADSEEAALKASAQKLWMFEDGKDEIEVGEFGQTDLSGYLNSRESTMRAMAAISQTPAHELLATIANLSAEALAAAEAGSQRKILERQTTIGEGWEQVLNLAASLGGNTPDDSAQVRWRDTTARPMAAVVDALGKAVLMLGVPAREVWERIPGVTQQDVERWKSEADRIGIPEQPTMETKLRESAQAAELQGGPVAPATPTAMSGQ